ncbi:hypothetical protein [Thiococcus pfennigii]|uniref:hypothetical protein n=1 Tax=Thiococcus pfennigii TaxID=1057 RepID=UPI001903C086|nr:hypothetical protein [Thiococcus pfennigii]MBK1702155.1 hypothetical protein [Thiococcus pfennigii]
MNLATNTLVIGHELEETAAALFSAIQVGLHGAKSETYEAIVPRLVARGANIVLAFTVMPSNRAELTDVLALSRALGVRGIRFIPLAAEG